MRARAAACPGHFLRGHIKSRTRGLSLNWSNRVWGDYNTQTGPVMCTARGLCSEACLVTGPLSTLTLQIIVPFQMFGGAHGWGMFLHFIHKASASPAPVQLEGKTAPSVLQMGCLTTVKPLEKFPKYTTSLMWHSGLSDPSWGRGISNTRVA